MSLHAFHWMSEQLRRPIERRSWQLRRLWRRYTYTGWHHADSGLLIWHRPLRSSTPERAPDEVIRLR